MFKKIAKSGLSVIIFIISSAVLTAFMFYSIGQTPAFAGPVLPTGGSFAAGGGTISSSGPSMTVNQSTSKGIINWNGFSIGKGGSVLFNNGSGATLNRVTGGSLSSIAGLLKATGSLYLINPSGIVITSSGSVITGGDFIASTLNESDSDFMNSVVSLSGLTGSVANNGTINSSGNAVLVGTVAVNTGTITSSGTASLISGTQLVLIPANGPSGILISPSSVSGNVTNSGIIKAASVYLSSADGDVYALAGNNGGLIEATGAATVNGQVWLTAPKGTVSVNNAIAASNSGNSGGNIFIDGLNTTIGSSSVLNASGTGGNIKVGIFPSLPESLSTTLSSGAELLAGGINEKGFIDTSGDTLKLGDITVNANGGEWLLDPADLTIDSTAATNIDNALNSGTNVTLMVILIDNRISTSYLATSSTVGTTTTSPSAIGTPENDTSLTGDINVDAPISWGSTNTLTLSAYNSINVNSTITASGGGGLVLDYDGAGQTSVSDAQINYGGSVNIPIGVASIQFTGINASGDPIGSLITQDGTNTAITYTLVNASNLSAVTGSGDYALASSIPTLTVTSVPTNTETTAFTGVFNGLGNTIGFSSNSDEGFNLTDSTDPYVGLFGKVSSGGIVENIGVGCNFQGSASGNDTGGIAGENYGTIENSYTAGGVLGDAGTSYTGGIAGENYGTIENSYSTAQVLAGSGSTGGIAGYNGYIIEYSYYAGDGPSYGVENTSASGTNGNGGIAGINGDLIEYSYSTGYVNNFGGTSGITYAGGIAGINNEAIEYSYWDTGTSGQAVGVGSLAAGAGGTGTGLTDSQMMQSSNFDWSNSSNGTYSPILTALPSSSAVTTPWVQYNGYTYPILTAFMAPVTITANNATLTYNDTSYSSDPNGTASSIAASLQGTLSYSITNSSNGTLSSVINAGTYTFTPGGLYSNQQGYIIYYAPGTLTINPADITVTTDSPAALTYNGSAYTGAPGYTVAAGTNDTACTNGLCGSDTLTGGTYSYSQSGSSVTPVNAGSYNISLTGLSNTNYAITYDNAGTLTINPAALTVTADNDTITYSDTAFTGGNGITASGLKGSDTVSSLGTPSYSSGTSQGAVNAGTYVITPSGLTDGNYTYTYDNGTLTINPALLTVTANNDTVTYSDTAFTGGNGITASGLQGTDTVSSLGTPSYSSGTSQGAVNAGTYAITPSGLTDGNYTYTYDNGTLTINPALLTVTADNDTITYSDTAFTGGNGITASGLKGSDTLSSLGTPSYSGTSQGAVNAGTYAITPSGLTDGNYTYTYDNGTLTINPALLTVTADNDTITYSDTAFTGGNGITASGLKGSDTVSSLGTPSYSGTSQGAVNAGTYVITPSGLTDGNYTYTYDNGTLTINPALLTVTADNDTITYSDTAFTGGNGITASGLKGSDTLSSLGTPSYSGASQGAVNAGTYVITPSGLTDGNYTYTYDNGTLTINPALLTVTADNDTITYSDTAFTGGNGITASGLKGSDTVSSLGTPSYSGTSQGAVNAGTYVITPSGLTDGNYTYTYDNGTLTINPASLTITATGTTTANQTYNGTDIDALTGATLSGNFYGQTVTLSNDTTGILSNNGNVGTDSVTTSMTLSGSGASNFTLTQPTGLTAVISPETLTYNAVTDTKTYDGTTSSSATPVLVGTLYNGDTVTGITQSFNSSNALGANGSALTVNTSGNAFTSGGNGSIAGDYAIMAGTNALGTINPALLTVTADNDTITYSDTAFTGGNGITASGLKGSDTLSSLGTPSYSGASQGAVNAGTYVITPSGLTDGNYTYTYDNGTLTINPALLTVTADNDTITYSDTAFTGGNGITASGLKGSDTVSSLGTPSYSGTSQGAVNAGTYVITPSGLTDGNYTYTYDNGTLTINPASLTVTANNDTITYSDTAFTGGNGITASGLKGSDTVSSLGTPSYSGTSQGAVNAGTYSIIPGGLTTADTNYSISFVNGTLTINQGVYSSVFQVVSRNAAQSENNGIPVLNSMLTGYEGAGLTPNIPAPWMGWHIYLKGFNVYDILGTPYTYTNNPRHNGNK